MENKERFVIELFLGLALIIFLVLLTFLVINVSNTKTSSVSSVSPVVVSNPGVSANYVQQEETYERPISVNSRYNRYDNNYYKHNRYDNDYYRDNDDEDFRYVRMKSYNSDRSDRKSYFYDEVEDKYKEKTEENFYGYKYSKTLEKPLEFDDSSRVKRYSNLIGSDVDDFEVYVANDAGVGGYFEVTYIFEDAYGRERKYSETKYVRAGKDIKFLYRDVTPHYSDYSNVRYEVKSLSEAPYKTVYYN